VQTLIVCLGNERVCDDGIGARVGRILQSLTLPSDVDVTVMATLRFDLLDALADAERLVVVDALAMGMGAEPGMCTVADVTELPAAVASADCAHRAAVSDIIDLARQVSNEGTLQNIMIAGIEGKQFLDYGSLFSDEVVAATPRLVDLILLAIGSKVEVRAMVKDACRRFSASGSVVLRSWRYDEVRAEVTGL
jgi:hydrogenase maturation protease